MREKTRGEAPRWTPSLPVWGLPLLQAYVTLMLPV